MSTERLGPYEIVRRIGAGGMAEVLLAHRAGPGGFAKPVALKRLLPEISQDEDVRAMFVEEARLQAALSHRNLVQVFDFGEENGAHFLAMEYVDGIDLAGLLAGHPRLAPPIALQIAAEVGEGLDYLHGRGIVHRDVSPGNVYLSVAGEVKLGDFGIAKGRAASLKTERGRLKGKLAYLSPEQARGETADARADVYALGLVLFEMLSGERYLRGDAEADLLRTAMEPVARPPGVGEAADALVLRLLAPRREDRLPSARLAAQAIREVQATLGPTPSHADLAALVTGRGATSRPARLRVAARHESTERLASGLPRTWPWVLAAFGGLAIVALAFALLPLEPEGPPNETGASTPGEASLRPDPEPAPAPEPASTPTPAPTPPETPQAKVRKRPASRPPPRPASTADPAAQEQAIGESDKPDDEKRSRVEERDEASTPAPPPLPPRLDRRDIERRLADLGARLEKSNLDSKGKERAMRLTQQALNDTIERRYAEADRRLNELEKLLASGATDTSRP